MPSLTFTRRLLCADLLTVREHLELYARIKGVPSHVLSNVVDTKLEELQLEHFEHACVGIRRCRWQLPRAITHVARMCTHATHSRSPVPQVRGFAEWRQQAQAVGGDRHDR